MTEQGGHCLFEGTAEQHGGPEVFLLPAIEVAVAVTARAGQILGNLGVAVGHRDIPSLPASRARASFVCGREWGEAEKFLPLAGGSEAVEVHQRNSVYNNSGFLVTRICIACFAAKARTTASSTGLCTNWNVYSRRAKASTYRRQ